MTPTIEVPEPTEQIQNRSRAVAVLPLHFKHRWTVKS